MHEFGCVAGAPVILVELGFFVRLQVGGADFVHLETEQIQLLGISLFVHDQRGLLRFERGAPPDEARKRFAFAVELGERIEDCQLFGGLQQGLVLVWSVNIHQPLANRRENIQRRRRTVDELPIRSSVGERSLEE